MGYLEVLVFVIGVGAPCGVAYAGRASSRQKPRSGLAGSGV